MARRCILYVEDDADEVLLTDHAFKEAAITHPIHVAGDGALFALSLRSAPIPLNAQLSGHAVVLSWPSASTGLKLEQNSNLATTNWTTSSLPISDNGTNKSVTIPSPAGTVFFRLANP